jgi:hypothetical protein
MKYKILALLPIAVAAFFPFFTGETFDTVEVLAVKMASVAGCVIAGMTLGPREYMGKAWLLNGLCMLLLVGYDLLRLPSVNFAARDRVVDVVGTVANLASVVGTFMLARAWRVAGVEPDLSPRAQKAILIVGALIAIGIAGPAAVLDFRLMIAGKVDGLVSVISDVSDALGLLFVAPVFLTALALRGGLLGWPWGLITAALVSWLGYDLCDALSSSSANEALRVTGEVFRSLACMYTFSAGVAQMTVVRAARRLTR